MKKLCFILSLAIILTAFTGCRKKDYPNDIPDWLEERIKEIKKTSFTYTYTINEYTLSSTDEFLYEIDYNSGWYDTHFYNYEGEEECYLPGVNAPFPELLFSVTDTCNNFTLDELVFQRLIWHMNGNTP